MKIRRLKISNMKYALVTGGTKGIGKAICQALLEKEYFVLINYANDDETANLIFQELDQQYNDRIKLIKADLSQQKNVVSFCNRVKEITQHLEILVLNVGKTDRTPFGKIDYQSFLNVFETNLFVPFFIIQELYSIMPEESSVVMTGSAMGIHPHSVSLAYGVSKSAVHSLVKNLVKYLMPHKLRINAIAPGFVETEWQKEKPEWIKESIKSKIALKRFCTTDEVAQLAMSIIENQYLNGEIIQLDGGYDFE